jgi:hypothetical protein
MLSHVKSALKNGSVPANTFFSSRFFVSALDKEEQKVPFLSELDPFWYSM